MMSDPADSSHWLGFLAAARMALLDASMKSVGWLTTAAILANAMRRCSAATRHLTWLLAVMGLFALPVLSWTLPAWNILPQWTDWQPSRSAQEWPPAAPDHRVAAAQPPRQTFEPAARTSPVPIAMVETAPISSRPPPAQIAQAKGNRMLITRFDGLWLAVWLAGFAAVILRTLAGMVGLWWLERGSRVETSLCWVDLLRRLVSGVGLRRPVLLLKSHRRQMPMTWGVIRPKLLLPDSSEDWPEERRRVVLLHELAHVRRWDYATNFVTRLACAAWWFNPMVWLAARQLAAERERACDDIVLNHGARPAQYAEQILQIAAGLTAGKWTGAAGIAMTRPTKLEGRLRAILDSTLQRAAPARWVALLMLAASLLVLAPVAMLRAAAPVAGGAPQTEVIFWQFLANKAVVDQLFPGVFAPSQTNSYFPMRLDGTNWFTAIQAAQRTGGVETAESTIWLNPQRGDLGSLNKISSLPYDEKSGLRRRTSLSVNGFYKLKTSAQGAKLDLRFSLMSSYTQIGFAGRQGGSNSGESGGEIKWRGTVQPGQALAFPAQLKGDLNPGRYHVAIFQAVLTPRHVAPDLRAMTSAPRWLADGLPGTLAEIQAARAWAAQAAMAATNSLADTSKYQGPEGTPVQIVAIGQPARWPLRWWDMNGLVVNANPAWQAGAENAAFGVLIRRGNLEGTLDCRLRLPDDPPMNSIAVGSGTASKPADCNLYLIGYPPDKLAQYFDSGGRVDLVVTHGVGDWQEIGRIRAGETREVDGGRFTLDAAEQRSFPNLVFLDGHFDYDPRYEIAFAAVNKRGKRSPVASSGGTGQFQRNDRRVFNYTETDNYDVDHFAILKRPAKEFVFPAIPTSPRVPVTSRTASTNELSFRENTATQARAK